VAVHGVVGLAAAVLRRVDAVVDDVDALRPDVEQAQHVVPRLPRDGDDRVGPFDRGALHPGAEMVGVAELLDLPGPQRFERVDGEHVGHAPELAGQHAGHVGVPGVAVDHLGVEPVLGHRQRAGEGVHGADEARVRAARGLVPLPVAADGEVALVRALVAEAPHFDPDQLRQRGAQVLHVDTGAAVDVRRVLLGEQGDLAQLAHGALPRPARSRAWIA
jgi:hypothetical protein